MGKPLATGIGVCSMCGKPLNAKGDCMVCLLRTGLDETVVEPKPAVLTFGDFEVEQHKVGSCWNLGPGPMAKKPLAEKRVLPRGLPLKLMGVPPAPRGS